ncbi:sporulation protein [Streptomyces sp. NPDC051840]|uniref:sporulation protein n=1 Tax=unclassified Streptomyces TaxID=2593676 RepID=UPI003423EDA0
MVFKRLLGSLGVGGPAVDTVLEPGAVVPGGVLGGQVHLQGGDSDFVIEQITLELVAHVEAEHEGGESTDTVTFHQQVIGGNFRLGEGERRSVPFTLVLPWETPVTELYGQGLGIALGVRTELGIADAKDKGDMDPLPVRPLPVQEAVLEALGQLGFGFRSADLELGHIHGTGQQLPFYQEIELSPSPRYAEQLNELEVTFLAGPDVLEVILEADKRGGFFSEGHDALNRYTVNHQDVEHTDWNAEVDGWISRLLDHRSVSFHGEHFPSASHAAPGHGEHHYGGHHEEHGHRSGSGMGTAVVAGAAGLAVGVAAGMVATEVVDEVGDFFEGDEADEDEG